MTANFKTDIKIDGKMPSYQDSIIINSISHSRMGEIALRSCVLYCSKQGICTANSKYNSPQSCYKSLGKPYPPEKEGILLNDKNARIELRVTQPEKNKIARLAESCGLSQSEYVRQRTLGYAPRTVQPDVFFDFYQTLCRLCDEVADKVSPETERKLLEVVDAIQQRLLLPEKSSAKQICKEVTTWRQQASGPSKGG